MIEGDNGIEKRKGCRQAENCGSGMRDGVVSSRKREPEYGRAVPDLLGERVAKSLMTT